MRKPFDGEFVMTQGFGGNAQDYVQFGLAGHNGVDWALPMGTPVLAAADGMVEDVGYDAGGYGYFIVLAHDGGVRTVYGHLSRALMTRGDCVHEGQVIGQSGSTGNSTGPHLHWTVKVAGQGGNGYRGAVDPMGYLTSPQDPHPNPPPEKGEGAQRKKMVVLVDGLRVRSGAGTSYREIGRLQRGAAVEAVEIWARRADGRWVAVYYQGDDLMR